MKNKHKLILGIIIIIIAAGSFFFRNDITGYLAFGPDLPTGVPETDNRVLYSPVQAVENPPGSKNYAMVQKYKVGNDEACIKDCLLSCNAEDLEYFDPETDFLAISFKETTQKLRF